MLNLLSVEIEGSGVVSEANIFDENPCKNFEWIW